MKLSKQILRRILIPVTVIVSLWTVGFYYAMIDEVEDEVDDSLDLYAEQIIRKQLRGEEVPTEDNATNNSFFFEEIAPEEVGRGVRYRDENIWIESKNEFEPARVLRVEYIDAEGKGYRLTVSTPTIEKAEVARAILLWSLLLCITLIALITIVIVLVVRHSLKPLERLVKWLNERKDISTPAPPLASKNVASEFVTLNEAAQQYLEYSRVQLAQQKEFVANASHEIQTPIAISTNRLELLLNTPLSEEQMGEVVKVLHTLEHISELNKSLLLLTKIESGQFYHSESVDISSLVTSRAEVLGELFAHRNISLSIDKCEQLVVDIDAGLARIMVDNLLRNAFNHNISGGRVIVEVGSEGLIVANSGTDEPLDAERIFTRFYHSPGNEHSNGLGLPIVAAIANRYGLKVEYSFANSLHKFKIYK